MLDIFEEIPDDHLQNVFQNFEKCVTWAPHVQAAIHTVIRWKKNPENREKMRIFKVRGIENADTILVKLQFYCNGFFVFTLDPSLKDLKMALRETRLINTEKQFVFCAIPTTCNNAVEYHKKKPKNVLKMYRCHTIAPEKAQKFDFNISEDFFMADLRKSDARKINSVWPYRSAKSEEFIETLIEMNGGCGLYQKSTNELVAWVVRHCLGILGLLQVDENHLRKGYGSLVTMGLSRKIALEGIWPLATIVVGNTASVNLFEKLGFHELEAKSIFTVAECD